MIGFLGRRYGLRIAALLTALLFFAGCEERAAELSRLITDAKQQHQKGNNNAAIIQLKNVLQKSPDNAEARYLLGVIYNDDWDFVSAEKELNRAVELRYDPAKAIPALGKSLLRQGKFQQVLDRAHIEGDVTNQELAEILTLRAKALLGLRRNREGRELLEQALAKQPEFADALLGQALLAMRERKLDEATRLVDRAVASAPESVDAWFLKGEVSSLTDQEAAIAAYQKVIGLNPKNISARLQLVSLHISARKFDKAREQIDSVRKIAPNFPMANHWTAFLEFRQGNYPAAREAVQNVLKVAPDYIPSNLLAGAIEFAVGSHVRAQSYLGRVVQRFPGNLYARKLLVSSLTKSGQVQRALEVLEPALKQAPEDSVLMTLAGDAYLQINEFAKAGQFYEKAAKLDPQSAAVRTGLGMSRLSLGETERALADLESAVQLDSKSYQADVVLISAHLQRANYDQALKALQSLEKKQPLNPLTYNLKAAIYFGKKDIATARKHLEHALQLKPTYVPAAMKLAEIDLLEKNPQAARSRLESILKRDKENAQALLALAELASRFGATQEQQIDWLERARKASPSAVQPELMLARLYASTGQPAKALEAAQRAQAASPEDSTVLNTLGAIQVNAGQKEQALATYAKLVAQQPNSPESLFRLATAQHANANLVGAVSTLKKVLALKPNFVPAQEMLVDLELRAGRNAEAMNIAQQAQKQFAKSPTGYVLEGDVLMREKKFSQAAKVYEIAYGMRKSGPIVIKMHSAYVQAGKPTEAEARLAQWLDLSPDDASVRLYAAHVSLQSGKYQSAIDNYKWLLDRQPRDVVMLNNLAWAYYQIKDKRALETAERAYKLQPDNAEIADTYGLILVEQGSTKRGIEVLQKTVDAAPKASGIRYHLAQALVKSGDKARARNELERLLSTDEKFAQHAEAMALLKELRN